jgi:hypothetical protein
MNKGKNTAKLTTMPYLLKQLIGFSAHLSPNSLRDAWIAQQTG